MSDIQVGDLIVWSANSKSPKMAIVYGFDINGNPLIIRHSDGGKQMATKSSVLVLARCCTGCGSPDQKITSAMDWWSGYDLPLRGNSSSSRG